MGLREFWRGRKPATNTSHPQPKLPSIKELKSISSGKTQPPNQPYVVDEEEMAEYLRRFKAPPTTGNSGS